jgi:hypothetical protein
MPLIVLPLSLIANFVTTRRVIEGPTAMPSVHAEITFIAVLLAILKEIQYPLTVLHSLLKVANICRTV